MTIRLLDHIPPGTRLTTSIVIVGAGPAGITLSLELAARSIDVTLLEGGGRQFDVRSQDRYVGSVELSDALAYPPLDAWRLRMLGGTSNHWGGWCRRLESNVFQDRPWLGGIAWPYDRADLESSYARAHALCELGRDEYDPAAIQSELGLDQWPDLDRSGLESSIWRYSPPTLFGERYRQQLLSGSVDLILHANVVALDAHDGAVHSVSVLGEDGALRSVQADVVVIASGGLESVRQLLHLEATQQIPFNESGWLGAGFMEHPHGVVGTALIERDLALDPTGPLAIFRERRPDADGVDVRAGLTIAPDVCADRQLPNMSFTIDPLPGSDDALTRLESGVGVGRLLEVIAGRSGVAHSVYMRSEQRLERASTITLSNDVDDLGLRRIHLNWRVGRQDFLDVGTGVELVASALAELGVAMVHSQAAQSTVFGLTGGAHHLGGARMHESARGGVVDPHLRVHGVDNLFVCSSSVFPAGGFSNPTLTVVALALRLAERLSL